MIGDRTPTEAGGEAHPEILVSTEWVAAHTDDPNLRVVEVDVDTTAYQQGHVPGAVGWHWQHDLQDPIRGQVVGKTGLEQLMRRSGIDIDTTVVLYGGSHNWFATHTYWLLKHYGHADVRLMDGGRARWLAEGRRLTNATPDVSRTGYLSKDATLSPQALADHVMHGLSREQGDR